MHKIIEVSHLQKMYGEKIILEDVTFSVERGEVFGLIGVSGAGKTTLINILTGQSALNRGTAKVFGERCNALSESTYRKIGMMMDTPALFEHLTCKQNLNVYAMIFGVDKRRISEVLLQVGLQEAANKYACNLSRGMRQRLVLARALLHSPELLFLDEPTNSLDPQNAQMVWKCIKELQRSGVTVFLTSHQMNEVARFCDHVVMLHKGQIAEEGSPKEICHKYGKNRNIQITLEDGSTIILPQGDEAIHMLTKYMAEGELQSAHTLEPNLDDVFLKITREEQNL